MRLSSGFFLCLPAWYRPTILSSDLNNYRYGVSDEDDDEMHIHKLEPFVHI